MLRSLRFIALFFLGGLLIPSSGAQAPAAGEPAAVLHTTTSLVLVDVVATEHGNAIHGLNQGQFHIFEAGREQTISSFDEHRPEAAPAAASPAAPPLPPHVYSNVPVYAEAGAINVLLLDGLNTPAADQMEVRRQMIQYLGKIPPGTSLAVFTLASRLRLVQGFTTNVAELAKAMQNPKAGVQPSVVLNPQNDTVLDSMNATAANTPWLSPEALSAMLQFQADLTAFQVDMRVGMTIEALQQLARYLSAIPGRKNLIWFSGSFPIALDPDDSLRSPFQAMRSYTEQMKQAAELLSAARVAVYPVDARGLMTFPSSDASYAGAPALQSSGTRTQGIKNAAVGSATNVGRDNRNFLQEVQTSQAGMEQIAAETGGKAFINTNGLKEAVGHAVENGSSYYTVGYVPGAKDFDGQYHKLQVRLDNCDCQLAYRQGFYADPPDKPSNRLPGSVSPIVPATLHGAPPSTQILFQDQVFPASNPVFQGVKLPDGPAGKMAESLKKPAQRYLVDLTVDAHGLAFDTLPDGAHQAQMEFALVAYDAEGSRVNYLDRVYAMKIVPDQFERTLARGIHVRLALDLPPGQGFLRIALHDLSVDRAGSLEIPLTVAPK